MKKDRIPFRIPIALLGLVLLLSGCDDSDKTIAKPSVIQKKLAVQAGRSQPPPPVAVAVPPQPEGPAPETKPALSDVKPQMPSAPAPERTSPPKPPPAAIDAQPQPEAPTPDTTPSLAEVKPQEPPAPVPKSPPPTGTAAGPATSTTVQPAVVGMVTQAALPPEGGKTASPGTAVTDAQVAGLLNIKAPVPYSAKGKVDPFEPLLRDETTSNVVQLKAKKRTPNTPLESIDIGQLKLVAIIGAAKGNLAMVQESSGKGYLIRPGTLIGTNSGKVVSIEANKVLFEEEYEDTHGKTITQKKEIILPKPPGEM